MPDGGRVLISTRNVRLVGDQEVNDGLGEPYVRVAVTDTGSGISEEIRDRVFEPFFSTKAPGRGTGLGLSMVFGFVEQSNGKIRLVDRGGGGHDVLSVFPPLRAAGDRPAPSRAPARWRPARATRQSCWWRTTSRSARCCTGCWASWATRSRWRAAGARRSACSRRGLSPDLLLTDVVLPEGPNGYELAAQARARQPRLKLLFTSGYSQGVASRRPPTVAGTFMLQKPFHRSELAHLIRRALDAPGA